LLLFFKKEVLPSFPTADRHQTLMNSVDYTITKRLPLEALTALLGAGNVVREGAELSFYSTDVYRRGDADAALVLRPGTLDELAQAVKLCTAQGLAVVPRGGGLSYTGGFLPVQPGSVTIDMQRLDRIIEVNATDMYVTVECGATWKSLYDRLQPLGLRTPYFGPMSGFASTVGGALSQGSIFLGSTQYGTTAESVLSLTLVLADGTIVNTGSAAAQAGSGPFFRHYGPDVTGLFLHDSGALAFKASTTLRLLRTPAHSGFAAFTFGSHAELLTAMSEISRRGLAAECYGADPYIWGMRLWDDDLMRDVKRLAGVVKAGRSLLSGMIDGARMAIKGRRALADVQYAMNVAVDGNCAAAVQTSLAEIRKIAKAGREIEPTVPRAVRGTPFLPPNDLLGPKGQRWAPSHGIVPHSKAVALADALVAFFAERAALLSEHGIEWGFVPFAISTNAILIEPMLYWPDARDAYHERMIAPGHLKRLPVLPPNPRAAEAMRTLRLDLTRFWMEQGCVHLQIGKTYRYLESRQPAFRTLLEQIKAVVDPHGLMNPGSLGLAAP
jgi:FAD/FMN-containing dehydrogenase